MSAPGASRPTRSRLLVSSALVTLSFLSSCGGQGADDAPYVEPTVVDVALAASVTRVVFTTSTSIPENPAPNVHVMVTDVTAVRALFQATITVPVQPPGEYHCPIDWGVRYRLAFTDGVTMTDVDLEPNGCQLVTIPGDPLRWTITQQGYWTLLAKTLGVPEAAIYPYTPPGVPQ